MTVKVFDIKKSDDYNHYLAEIKNVKGVRVVGFDIELTMRDNSKVGYRTDLYGIEIKEIEK